MATCKFGADDQHLQGKERAAFIKKCMSSKDEPRGGPPGAPPALH
jgi:psiF repeat